MWVNDRVIFLVEEKEERIQQDKKKNRNSIYNSCKNHIMINDTNWNAYNVETTTVGRGVQTHIHIHNCQIYEFKRIRLQLLTQLMIYRNMNKIVEYWYVEMDYKMYPLF